MILRPSLFNISRGQGWANAPEFADLAHVADHQRGLYAITTVPLANIAAATAAQLAVKRPCSVDEIYSFTFGGVAAARAYTDRNGVLRNDLSASAMRFDWLNGKRQLALNGASVNLLNGNASGGTAGVMGSGGTFPAGWIVSAFGGMTVTISYPTVNDLPVCRVRMAGTPGTTGGQYFRFEGANVVAAGTQQCTSAFFALSSGAVGGTTFELRNTSSQSGVSLLPFATTLTRVALPQVVTGTDVQSCVRLAFPDTVTPQDFTIDIAVPQREAGATFASPPIIGPAGTTRALESARYSPTIEAILQRNAASIVVRGQNMQQLSQVLVSTSTGTADLLRASGATLLRAGGPVVHLSTLAGPAFQNNSFAGALAFNPAGRSVVRNGAALVTDANQPLDRVAPLYLGRAGAIITDGHYDFDASAPSRLSDARLTTLAVVHS